MDLERVWRALTTGERTILVVSGVLVATLVIGGALLLGFTPFQTAQTTPGGADIVDTDGDGLSDDNEALLFGTNPEASDTDGDGLPDGWEAEHSQQDPSTGLIVPDPASKDADADPDDDGLDNAGEFEAGTDPWRADTDGDGLSDGWEVDSDHDPLEGVTPTLDQDGDGLTADEEFQQGTLDDAVDTDRDGLSDTEEPRGSATIGGASFSFTPTDPSKTSTGGSGLADGFAVVYDLDPHGPNVGRIDHDDDGLNTGLEAQFSLDRFNDTRTALLEGLNPRDEDSDGDSLPDGWEVTHDLDPLDPADGNEDSDGDGLSNGREFFWRTDPLTPDTDEDGLEDGTEVTGFTITVDGNERRATSNPRLADSDNDGLDDLAEREGEATVNGTQVEFNQTHPLLPDTDGDGLGDDIEVTRTYGDDDRRLDPTQSDTDNDGLDDGPELRYWDERQADAESSFPTYLQPPTSGACQAQAASAITTQDPSVVGPGGDADGDCIPNVLDTDSDRNGESDLPPGTQPVPDGREIEPPSGGSTQPQLPASDPAALDTDGDDLPDEWEIRWARFKTDVTGSPAWILDPTKADSDADKIPDGEDDFEGEGHVRGTPSCWDTVQDFYPDFNPDENTGDGVPWGPDYPNTDEMQTDTDPIGSLACDSDEDGLVDGWEARPRPHLDPKRAIESPWTGSYVQTICYPTSSRDPSLPGIDDVVGSDRILDLGEIPESGPVTTDASGQPTGSVSEEMLPPEDITSGSIVWAASQTGCAWSGDGARLGSDCQDCRVLGAVVTLELRQWAQTTPPSGSGPTDTDGDGGPDAWEIVWWLVAGQRSQFVNPSQATGGDLDQDSAGLAEEYAAGCSPLTADTDGDQENDGPDQNCLSESSAAVPIEDADGDHLLDDPCGEGDPAGTFRPETSGGSLDTRRVESLRQTGIIELEKGLFLCEPPSRADPDGSSIDSDGDDVPDALELLAAYEAFGTPKLLSNDPDHDPDGDSIPTNGELQLGRPADWPDASFWWFGSDPFTENGYDADGDGLADGLLLDEEPFENLPEEPTASDAGNAFQLACRAGIVRPLSVSVSERCPDASGSSASSEFSWASSTPDTPLDVNLVRSDLGQARGSDRVVDKDGSNLPARVEVTEDGSPVSGMPVALMALDAIEAQQLKGSDLSVLAQPDRVVCIVETGSDGTATTSACPLASGPASADLTGTGRSWLGSTSPQWTRDLSVLDPTRSDELEASQSNQPKIAAWAMGSGSSVGGTDQEAVITQSEARLSFEDLPASPSSGSTISVTAGIVDGGGDPLQAGTLTLTSGDQTEQVTVDGQPTVTLGGISLPNVTEATPHTLNLSYKLRPAIYVPQNATEQTVDVLPSPSVSIDPPNQAVANTTVEVGVRVIGPNGDPVSGPVNLTLGQATATGQTDADGRATLSLTVPGDVRPKTGTLEARFEGTDEFGVGSAQQNVPVLQRLTADVSPTDLRLGRETGFSVDLVDLAGRAPALPLQVQLSLGNTSATTKLEAGNSLASVLLPVRGSLGDAQLEVNANTSRDRQYVPLVKTVPVQVSSTSTIQVTPDSVPRGEQVDLTANVTDELGRPVPTAQLSASWSSGSANVSVEDGQATIPFSTPPAASPEPVTLTLTLDGPGVLPTQRTQVVRLLVGTNLTADIAVDSLAGIVSVQVQLTDDQGAAIAGAPVNITSPLGEPVTVRTNAEGRAEATLPIPDDAEPGDVPLQVRYEGTDIRLPSEAFGTVPVRAPTGFDVPDEVLWSSGNTLKITGRVVAAETNETVSSLPVRAIHGDEVVATSGPGSGFRLSMSPDEVASFAGDARRFTLRLETNGSSQWAPAETTLLVERRIPVSIATAVNRTGDRTTVHVEASTPRGPLSEATISIGQENGPPVTVQTDSDGEASVQLSSSTGTLVARYQGDDSHAPAQATVQLSQPAAPAQANLGWLIGIGVLALLAVDAWIVYRVIQRVRVGRQVEEVLDELEDRLVLGDEVQAAIYHAYLQLRATAEVLGTPEEETETVREFGHRFADRLQLEQEPVGGLVDIFEQAWYGQVDPGMRTQAIERLRRLQDHLRERGLVG